MPTIRILTEAELRAVIDLSPRLIDHVEAAFRSLARGEVVLPAILSMPIARHNGEVDVKTAYMEGLDSFAIKISPGFFDNPSIGLPSTSGLMVVLSAKTGQVQALLLDNGYLTDLRTAAAGAVAARALARADAASACIFGAGLQARMQLRALCMVRPIRRASVWARDAARAGVMADEMSKALGIAVVPADDPASAAREADLIVTTTPATSPILLADWLREGQHITAMGSDQHGKNEVDPLALRRVLYVPDRLDQTRELGELRVAIAAGIVAPGTEYAELGAVLNASAPGRQADDEITLADLTGTGVQDTAIAALALSLAQGRGTEITT